MSLDCLAITKIDRLMSRLTLRYGDPLTDADQAAGVFYGGTEWKTLNTSNSTNDDSLNIDEFQNTDMVQNAI